MTAELGISATLTAVNAHMIISKPKRIVAEVSVAELLSNNQHDFINILVDKLQE